MYKYNAWRQPFKPVTITRNSPEALEAPIAELVKRGYELVRIFVEDQTTESERQRRSKNMSATMMSKDKNWNDWDCGVKHVAVLKKIS